MMTFDNIPELEKIAAYYPEAELVMRIMADDSQSICKFNSKFGVGEEDYAGCLAKVVLALVALP